MLSLLIGILVILCLITLFQVVNLSKENKRLKAQFEEKRGEYLETLENYRETLGALNDKILEYEQREIDLKEIVDKETHNETKAELEKVREEYVQLKGKYDSFVSKRKSSEVKLGAIAETLTPFLEGFPYNPKNLRSLGSPIDYVSFEEEGVTFIEVKSGDSKLSKKQKDIKKLIEEGKVKFEIHRIGEKGLKVEE